MTDIQDKSHKKAMQFYDLVEKENHESNDDKEENKLEVNNSMIL